MTSIFGVMDLGRQGLFASQKGLQITGQNIANVNTEGYTRQEAIFESLTNLRGVRINEVRRIRDSFLEARKQDSLNSFGFAQTRLQSIARLETILDETQNDGIGVAFSNFFQSLQDLTLNPGNATEREAVRSQALNLTQVVQTTYGQLQNEQQAANQRLESEVDEINAILSSIAEINKELVSTKGLSTENELLDRRQVLIYELQERMPANLIKVSETNPDPGISLYTTSGFPLVLGDDAATLEVRPDSFNNAFYSIIAKDSSGLESDITDFVTSGTMGGALSMRDGIIPEQLEWIDRLVAEFSTAFNMQHQTGTSLAGSTDIDFFSMVNVQAQPTRGNSLNAQISGDTVYDQSLLTFDDYEIVFTGPGTYDVLNTSQGTTVVSGATYTSGNPIQFDGIQVTITNSAGAPQAGDSFSINTVDEAATMFNLSSAIEATIDNIAAGNTSNSGDNENALALADMENMALIGSASIGNFIDSKLTKLGIDVNQINSEYEASSFNDQQVGNFIEAVSGVSLDEESANLIRFQRSYQAAARVITTLDELTETLINLVR